MLFQDLRIKTRRERPARAKTDGQALLIRAGYWDADGELTDLGNHAVARLRTAVQEASDLSALLRVPLIEAADGELVAECDAGDRRLLRCHKCGYAASIETAKARKRAGPPEAQSPIERVSTPDCSTIEALAAFLGVPPARTAKALMYVRPGSSQLVLVVIRGDMQISERKLHDAEGALQPASQTQIINAGATPGFASPIGLHGAHIVVDDLIPDSVNLVAGANEPGYHLRNTNYGRDYRADKVADLVLAHSGDPCSVCGSSLQSALGMRLGDHSGILFGEVLRALAELFHDNHGLRFPFGAAAFDVHLMHLPARQLDTKLAAVELHRDLESVGVRVLFDDREERAGVKFKDADLIGCPLRVTVGERNLADRMVEFKKRNDDAIELVPMEAIVSTIRSITLMPR